MSGTYSTYAALYFRLGYGVPLPIPYGEKESPPRECYLLGSVDWCTICSL